VITSARCFRQFIGLGYLSIPHDPITSGYGYVSGARRRTTSSSLALLRLWLVPSSRLFHMVNKWMVADWKGAVAVTLTCLWSRRARSGGWPGLSEPHLTFLWRPPSIWAQTAVSVCRRVPAAQSSLFLFYCFVLPVPCCDQNRVSLRAYSNRHRDPLFLFRFFCFHFSIPFSSTTFL
jgi:hypothetical protein